MNLMKITSNIIILACLASATALAVPSQATAPDFADIDAYVVAQMKDLRIPGLALAIVQGDQIVHLKGFGVADPSGRAVTPQTPFILGSLSKSFTALAIMQLVEAGQGRAGCARPALSALVPRGRRNGFGSDHGSPSVEPDQRSVYQDGQGVSGQS